MQFDSSMAEMKVRTSEMKTKQKLFNFNQLFETANPANVTCYLKMNINFQEIFLISVL